MSFMEKVFGHRRNTAVELGVMKKYVGNKYWKNFHGYDRVDRIDFEGYTKRDMQNFWAAPRIAQTNFLELITEPAVKNVTFSLESAFKGTKPLVSFEWREEKPYCVGDTKVYELARIFLRSERVINGQKVGDGKTIMEGCLILMDNGVTVEYLPVLVNGMIKGDSPVTMLAAACNTYAAIQFAFKNRPTVFRKVGDNQEETGAKASKTQKRTTTCQRYVVVKEEVRELIAGHFTVKRETKCLAWGVAGHYRHYKDGRVVWVRPYVKGVERNNPQKYSPKTYKFVRENNIKKEVI